MTTSRTRKSTSAPRESAAQKKADAKAAEPMDPSADEQPVSYTDDGAVDVQPHAPFSERDCWAIDVLMKEVAFIYPEATTYISERSPRGVGLAVTFEGWDAHHENEPGLPALLTTIGDDERIEEITSDGTDDQGDNAWVCVRMRANPLTMDLRDPFGLYNAYTVMVSE